MRFTLVEYGEGIDADCLLLEDGVTLSALNRLIEKANLIIQRSLGISRTPLVLSDGKLRALGIAGSIKLSKTIELEIVPKMLEDVKDSNWKESLFLLAALSKYGNIISTNHIHSATAYKDSLYDIAGRILSREYLSNRRKPIRQYRKEQFMDFAIDGEIDFNTVFEKNPDGIVQERVSFDIINPFNGTIREAMKIVLPYVKDGAIRHSLVNAIQELNSNSISSKKRLSIPPRNKEWTNIYNLSFDIVSGMGSTLDNGEILSPSFIVDTWRIWEWLITIAMKIGLSSKYQTIPQDATTWGIKRVQDKVYKVNVYPDVAIYEKGNSEKPSFLVDAKYKVISERSNGEVDRADIYEAFAFCSALGVKRLFLAYPTIATFDQQTGSVSLISNYEINDITISAIKVAFGSITKQGDITSFCKKMAADILSVVN